MKKKSRYVWLTLVASGIAGALILYTNAGIVSLGSHHNNFPSSGCSYGNTAEVVANTPVSQLSPTLAFPYGKQQVRFVSSRGGEYNKVLYWEGSRRGLTSIYEDLLPKAGLYYTDADADGNLAFLSLNSQNVQGYSVRDGFLDLGTGPILAGKEEIKFVGSQLITRGRIASLGPNGTQFRFVAQSNNYGNWSVEYDVPPAIAPDNYTFKGTQSVNRNIYYFLAYRDADGHEHISIRDNTEVLGDVLVPLSTTGNSNGSYVFYSHYNDSTQNLTMFFAGVNGYSRDIYAVTGMFPSKQTEWAVAHYHHSYAEGAPSYFSSAPQAVYTTASGTPMLMVNYFNGGASFDDKVVVALKENTLVLVDGRRTGSLTEYGKGAGRVQFGNESGFTYALSSKTAFKGISAELWQSSLDTNLNIHSFANNGDLFILTQNSLKVATCRPSIYRK